MVACLASNGEDVDVLIGRGERRAEEERGTRLRLFRDAVQGEHCDEAFPIEAYV
jgi:hypothetical protein